MIRTALFALAIAAVADPTAAALACTGREPWRGPPPHAAPPVTAWPEPAAFSDAPFADAGALDAAFEQAVAANHALSLTVAVWAPGRGFWSARREADGVEARALHGWASAGKLATAVATLQLIEEDRIAPGDPLTRWRDDVPNGRWITVDQLLTHTSGLFSANEDPAARADPRYRDIDEAVAIAARSGALFCPGEDWRYTNTGYQLLGQIIAESDGVPYAAAITARTFGRLGLSDARVLDPADAASDVQPFGPPGPGEPRLEPAWPGAAGAVVATPQAMIRLLHGALTGELLPVATARSMLESPSPMFGAPMFYGRGLMLYDVPTPDGALYWIGHSGGAPGVKSVVAWSPAQQAYVAVALTGGGSAEATANLLLKALAGIA